MPDQRSRIFSRGFKLDAVSRKRGGGWWNQFFRIGGMAVAERRNGINFYIVSDHLGTPKKYLDHNGVLNKSVRLRPFGDVEASSDIYQRFPGQYDDPDTRDLYQNGFRDYDPWAGRYIQSDPIGLGGGVNTYGYVGGNPVMRVDPRGLQEGAAACALGPLGCLGGAAYEAGKWTLAICIGVGAGVAVSNGIDAMSNSNDDDNVVPLFPPIPATKSCKPGESGAGGGNCQMCNLKQSTDLGEPTTAERGPFPASARKWRCVYDCGSLGLMEIPDTLISVIGCPGQMAAANLVTYPK